MFPTMFKLPFLPDWLADIKSYGVMMMIAFLSGIWFACRRAERTQADPDTVLNVGFLSLIFGVLGARIMFVTHYWDTRFASINDSFGGWLMAVLDFRSGGLEFWGGPLLVVPVSIFYLRYVAKTSVRWYIDIAIPSLAWGLAVTRIGCFLNGCCWGATCVNINEPDVHLRESTIPWAVQFPYGSPTLRQQYEFGQITLPRELVFTLSSGQTIPYPRDHIELAVADGGETVKPLIAKKAEALKAYREKREAGADAKALKAYKDRHEAADAALKAHYVTPVGMVERHCKAFGITPAQLEVLSHQYRARPVHPSQLYAVINAFIICFFLSNLYYYRKRHGIILGWFLILYSISRLFLEGIRQDNPLDIGGVTISQAISIGCLTVGLLWIGLMYRLPERSPRAQPFVYEEEEEEKKPPPKARPAKRKN